MKILLVSDEECLYLWDYYRPGRLDGIDLIISCGDLNAEYLSFLVTMESSRAYVQAITTAAMNAIRRRMHLH